MVYLLEEVTCVVVRLVGTIVLKTFGNFLVSSLNLSVDFVKFVQTDHISIEVAHEISVNLGIGSIVTGIVLELCVIRSLQVCTIRFLQINLVSTNSSKCRPYNLGASSCEQSGVGILHVCILSTETWSFTCFNTSFSLIGKFLQINAIVQCSQCSVKLIINNSLERFNQVVAINSNIVISNSQLSLHLGNEGIIHLSNGLCQNLSLCSIKNVTIVSNDSLCSGIVGSALTREALINLVHHLLNLLTGSIVGIVAYYQSLIQLTSFTGVLTLFIREQRTNGISDILEGRVLRIDIEVLVKLNGSLKTTRYAVLSSRIDGSVSLLSSRFLVICNGILNALSHFIQDLVFIARLIKVGLTVSIWIKNSLLGIFELLEQLVCLILSLEAGSLVEELGDLLVELTVGDRIGIELILQEAFVCHCLGVGSDALHKLLGSRHHQLGILAIIVHRLIDEVVDSVVDCRIGISEVLSREHQTGLSIWIIELIADEEILVVSLLERGDRADNDLNTVGLIALKLELHFDIAAISLNILCIVFTGITCSDWLQFINTGLGNLNIDTYGRSHEVCTEDVLSCHQRLVNSKCNIALVPLNNTISSFTIEVFGIVVE